MTEEQATVQIKVTVLLNDYLEWVDADAIKFLKEKERKAEVKKHIEALHCIMEKIEGGGEEEGRLWYKAHKEGRKLWEILAKYALRDIVQTAKGNSALYSFLNAATEFEDILYGLESHYRDHTLHSLWVYLIGEYILREKLAKTEIPKTINWYLYNDIKKDEDKISIPEVLVSYSEIKASILNQIVTGYADAIWCIVALCHDLGYSLEKLSGLNDKVKTVLKYFDISDVEHTGYSLNIEHQYLVSQFLELMAADVRIVPGEDYNKIDDENNNILEKLNTIKGSEKLKDETKDVIRKLDSGELIKLDTAGIIKSVAGLTLTEEVVKIKQMEENTLIKCYRDDSTYWRLCRALEKKQHGILSAYLIYKILGIFADATVRGSAEEWGLDDDEAVDNIIRGDILFAIAQHEFDFAHIFEFNSLADVLVLSDELEEFSRLGRPLQSREYLPTTARASVDFTPEGDNVGINIIYDVDERQNLISFFIRKAERLCSLYSLNERNETEEPYRIRQITMTARKGVQANKDRTGDTLDLIIEMKSSQNSIARLPKYESSKPVSNNDTKGYPISLYDDKISITAKDAGDSSETMLLSEWFGMINKKKTSPKWKSEIKGYLELRE